MTTNDKETEAFGQNQSNEEEITFEQKVVTSSANTISAKKESLITIGFVFIGFFVGQFVASMATLLLAVINGMGLAEMQSNPNSIYDYLSLTEVLSSQMLYTLAT